MSKMIRVENCGGCDHKNRSRVDYYCDHPESANVKFAAVIIPDQSKILPNCPLEDYQHSDKLDKIKSWCEAYPVKLFPEPDFDKAHKVLKDNGMTIDSIGASSMRHVLKGIKEIIGGE